MRKLTIFIDTGEDMNDEGLQIAIQTLLHNMNNISYLDDNQVEEFRCPYCKGKGTK